MNPANVKRSEDTEQMQVVQWSQYSQARFPELKWLHHVPNGGGRKKTEAVKLKQMGGESRCGGFMPAIPERDILRDVHRNEIRKRQEAGNPERIFKRHGSRGSFCVHLLFCPGSNQGAGRIPYPAAGRQTALSQ